MFFLSKKIFFLVLLQSIFSMSSYALGTSLECKDVDFMSEHKIAVQILTEDNQRFSARIIIISLDKVYRFDNGTIFDDGDGTKRYVAEKFDMRLVGSKSGADEMAGALSAILENREIRKVLLCTDNSRF